MRVTVPGDKSISHRALLAALLSGDPVADAQAAEVPRVTEVRGANLGGAVMALLPALRRLGYAAARQSTTLCLRRVDQPADTPLLDVGESSAAARLLLGTLAGLGWCAVIDGSAGLRQRPMDWLVDPLRTLGARIRYLGGEGRLPVAVEGPVDRGGAVELRVGSAQARAGVLLAAVAARVPVTVRYPVLSRDHTERMLASFGANLAWDDHELTYRPGGLRVPAVLQVPGDPSLAAYPAAVRLLRDGPGPLRLTGVCLNPTRLGFFEVLRAAGADITYTGIEQRHGEPVGTIVVTGGLSGLCPLRVDDPATLHALIDEVPLLAALATRVPGGSRIGHAAELSFKETDRLATTVGMLRPFGAEVAAEGAAVAVTGGTGLRAAETDSFGDHRIAMAAATLAVGLDGCTRVRAGTCHVTSFPEFTEVLRGLGADLTTEGAAMAGAPGEVTLRGLRETDYPQVSAHLEQWWDGRPVMLMLPRLFFRHFADTSVAAEHDGRVVGFLVGIISPSVPGEAHIHFVGVDPALRGRGLGRRMYERFFGIATAYACHTVTAVTSVGNTDSQAFHLAMGFTPAPAPGGPTGGRQVWADWDGPTHDRIRFQWKG